MTPTRLGSPCTSRISSPRPCATALLIIAFALLFAQTAGQAASGDALPGDALPYSKGFLVTGNYVVGLVDLTSQQNPADANGYATGTIPISDHALDGGANLIAAYLYFEAIHPYPIVSDGIDPAVGVKFRGVPIIPQAMKHVEKPLSSGGATCWGSAGQGSFAVSTYRANVLSLMPKQHDLQGKWTGKYIVNSAELPVNAQHTVTLREKTGDSAVQSAGATLFLVYRSRTEPLRKIVVYDGLYTAYGIGVTSSTAEADTMTQHLRGFYKSTGPSMRITHVVGTGGNNQTEKITVTSQTNTITFGPPPVSADPFPQTSPNSDRSWSNPTYNVGTLPNPILPGTVDSTYGETVTTTVKASNTNPAACRAWTAVFASFNVADEDADGLPDGVEDGLAVKDADNTDLPSLKAMGAKSKNPDNSLHPDLFVEYTAMWAPPGTTYGSPNAPYPNTTAACYDADTKSCTDLVGHHHFVTPEDIKRIGDRYKAHNITFHIDVGSVSAYHGLGVVQHTDWEDDYTSTVADEYLVGNGVGDNVAALARGGEVVRETKCDPTDPACTQLPSCDSNDANCIFPDYPGTVGWKIGYLAMRNAPVGDDGQELNPDLTGPNGFSWVNSQQQRLRFDRARRPYVHYALGAHARGTPSSPLPCLDDLPPLGQPTGYAANTTTCAVAPNPQFHVPSGSRGLSDLPGRNVLLALGLWDEFVGRPFNREGALFHELGHNMNLWHSGRPADFGNATTATVIYPNCNPFILSSMSYLYSIHGLFDPNGFKQLDYSWQALSGQAESGLLDGSYSTTPDYQRAWYAPANSPFALNQGVEAATRFCSGVQFAANQPAQAMARVLSDTYTAPAQQGGSGAWSIDWDGGGQPVQPQDANFDGTPNSFSGFNDWANIRPDQISAGGLGGGTEDFILVAHPAADDLFGLGGDDLFGLGGDDLYVLGGDDLYGLGGDDLYGLGGDDLFGLGGDDLFGLGGDDLFGLGGDDLFVLGGDVQPEPTYAGAKGLGRTAPYELSACIVRAPNDPDADDCFVTAQPFTAQYHRVALRWQPATVGHLDPVLGYQVQRRRADPANSPFEDVGNTTTNYLIDDDVLPKLPFIYRVRAHFDDPTAASGWAYLLGTPIVARNDLPAPRADSYVTPKNTMNSFTVLDPGVLGVSCTSATQCVAGTAGTFGDPSSDNPTSDNLKAYVARRAVKVSEPVIRGTNTLIGTLNLNSNGGFTLTFPSSFTGFITFQYKANDGFWSVDSNVPMNGKDGQNPELFSAPVTVTVEIKKK